MHFFSNMSHYFLVVHIVAVAVDDLTTLALAFHVVVLSIQV